MSVEKIHFVTGRLAETALREMVAELSKSVGFDYSVQVLPITVAALLTPQWIASRIEVPADATRVVLPGYAAGDLRPIKERVNVPVELGPKDLRRLPEYFGQVAPRPSLEQHDIQIIAEINHAPRMELAQIVENARELSRDGADLIDVGCEPGVTWDAVQDCVAALVGQGLKVSIDSLNPAEIGPAVQAGAELVLSVNSSNRQWAPEWGCEVVVIPDDISDLKSMETTIEFLDRRQVRFRLDPILEPVGFGFAKSLERYWTARRRWPEFEIMMGIGNLTELSDVDSAGINFLLLAVCQELKIRSVLTTQVINWARSSVRECDIARRMVHYAITNRVPPKRISEDLICLRDSKLLEFGNQNIEHLAASIKDHNYRLLAEGDQIHLLGGGRHLSANDPFELFDQLAQMQPRNLDAAHAFYLGYEMCKAAIANLLGKQYVQDEALSWGHLTVSEADRRRLSKRSRGRGD